MPGSPPESNLRAPSHPGSVRKEDGVSSLTHSSRDCISVTSPSIEMRFQSRNAIVFSLRYTVHILR